MDDDLQPEYELRAMRARQFGPGRTQFGASAVSLEPDVAKVFPDAKSVNEALRFLIRIAKENKQSV
jgi:hypothetical protein